MSLSELQALGRLRPHKKSRREVDDLLRLAERDLGDARVEGVSTDRRFMITYEDAVALPTIPLHCAGLRTDGPATTRPPSWRCLSSWALNSPHWRPTSIAVGRSETPAHTIAPGRRRQK